MVLYASVGVLRCWLACWRKRVASYGPAGRPAWLGDIISLERTAVKEVVQQLYLLFVVSLSCLDESCDALSRSWLCTAIDVPELATHYLLSLFSKVHTDFAFCSS